MRYLPLAEADRRDMLRTIGASSVEDLFTDVPEAARLATKIDGLPEGTTPRAIERVGVIGAGTMGGGISMNFLSAGIPVTPWRWRAMDRSAAWPAGIQVGLGSPCPCSLVIECPPSSPRR